MKPFCAMPFVRAFVMADGKYRNCCAVDPEIVSDTVDFAQWWNHDQKFLKFKEDLLQDQFPVECQNCAIQERTGSSMRTNINQLNPTVNPIYPKEWSIHFGNACNLACWTCNENFSSTIAVHKERAKILPLDFKRPNVLFKNQWPQLRASILESYSHHDEVTVSILGGEPAYNNTVFEFLEDLLNQGLAQRTRLEITTNGTYHDRIFNAFRTKNTWKYLQVFVSVDAIGNRAEWIRYGSNWQEVTASVDHYIAHADYVEIHTTLSVLNIQDLPDVVAYVHAKGVKHTIIPLVQPSYMSLMSWDGPDLKLDRARFQGLESYLDLVGESPVMGSYQTLTDYIQSFDGIRQPKPIDQKF